MNNNNCYCVIMAGGAGTRFWPVSRTAKPKQFLDVAETGKTFIRHTYERFLDIVPQENIIIATAEKYKDLVKAEIPELDDRNLLLEPYARNTAPCIAWACWRIHQEDSEANIVVTPSDAVVMNPTEFQRVINNALLFHPQTVFQ